MSSPYTPDLISQLEEDHREIRYIVSCVGKAIQSKSAAQIQDQLHLLKSAIVGHKAHENWKLYTFLQRAARNNLEISTSMNNVRKGADQFVKHVEEFFERYLDQNLSPEMMAPLETEFKAITEGIAKRFQIEEKTLFPMYKNYQ